MDKLIRKNDKNYIEDKNDLLISTNIDKEPYIKKISDDKIINLTGESGSGKSYYAKKFINDNSYIVIDTDEIFARYDKATGINKELGIWFRKKYDKDLDICSDFPLIYKDIIEYVKYKDKTIIIDSAQFRNLKTDEEISLLKGQVIVMRTCVDTCYERCIDRWKMKRNNNYTDEELEKYKKKKLGMYEWYKSLNIFIKNIDKL